VGGGRRRAGETDCAFKKGLPEECWRKQGTSGEENGGIEEETIAAVW